MIREGAVKAARKLKESPASFQYVKMNSPYIRTARFRKRGDAPPYAARDAHPDSFIALMNKPYTPTNEN